METCGRDALEVCRGRDCPKDWDYRILFSSMERLSKDARFATML